MFLEVRMEVKLEENRGRTILRQTTDLDDVAISGLVPRYTPNLPYKGIFSGTGRNIAKINNLEQ